MTTVININNLSEVNRRVAMADKLRGFVYIGRRANVIGKWANKYSHKPSRVPGVVMVKTREEAVARHEADTRANPELMEAIKRELRGKTLICWCSTVNA